MPLNSGWTKTMDIVRLLTGEVKLHLWNGNQTFQSWDRKSLEIREKTVKSRTMNGRS